MFVGSIRAKRRVCPAGTNADPLERSVRRLPFHRVQSPDPFPLRRGPTYWQAAMPHAPSTMTIKTVSDSNAFSSRLLLRVARRRCIAAPSHAVSSRIWGRILLLLMGVLCALRGLVRRPRRCSNKLWAGCWSLELALASLALVWGPCGAPGSADQDMAASGLCSSCALKLQTFDTSSLAFVIPSAVKRSRAGVLRGARRQGMLAGARGKRRAVQTAGDRWRLLKTSGASRRTRCGTRR
ncbi:hypothetical protein K458DRAFT_467518 [Lentithecium fluviatile CBS 122367]|uniref:Uncharacterized protein n=1 Tax=Lentithecium fluviatile CBS 122367 TaxID=1168545 RepID=A0A6G1JCT7_9PLEO|nr:hypothetical protein K458DRAFT_467518 [Lentithecium fluviatile CBS 122367]